MKKISFCLFFFFLMFGFRGVAQDKTKADLSITKANFEKAANWSDLIPEFKNCAELKYEIVTKQGGKLTTKKGSGDKISAEYKEFIHKRDAGTNVMIDFNSKCGSDKTQVSVRKIEIKE